MRFFSIIFFPVLFLNLSSCKTQQKASEEKILLKVDTLDNGSKKLYLLKNKKLEILEDKGFLSYKIEDDEKTNVLLFVYAINQDQIAYDGGYKEEIIFEVPNDTDEKNYTNKELQNTKMLFGRYCFCRGKNGVFKVKQGKIHIKSSKKEIHFELQFKINEVPQVTENIEF